MVTRKSISRVGIFGGTFNPIHVGHLRLAERAVRELGLDVLYFLPTNVPPHKSGAGIIDIRHREKMVRLAISGNHFFAFSGVESRAKGPAYTVDTVLRFRRDFPGAEIFYITGGDTLPVFHLYRRYADIIANAKLVVARRPSAVASAKVRREVMASSVFLSGDEQLDVSSTMIREYLSRGFSVRYLVPEKVRAYISENGLYSGEAGS